MGKERLLAFSDGVIAIIITIMVLELHPPQEPTLQALAADWPVFLSYVMSFVYVAIYWNNHHHLMTTVERVNGPMLWANMHLLFWLSLVPFTTAWMGRNEGAVWPTAVYGLSLLAPALAYTILVRSIVSLHGRDHALKQAIGADWKGWGSLALYASGIAAALSGQPLLAKAVYAAVALIWLVPDPRIERLYRGGSAG